MQDFLRYPDAPLWAHTLNSCADYVAHALTSGIVSNLKSLDLLEEHVMQLYGAYRYTKRKELLRNCSPRQQVLLEEAETRMREARASVGTAFQIRREQAEAEKNLPPGELKQLDDQRRNRDKEFAALEQTATGTES